MLKGRGGDGSVARQLQRFAGDKFAPVGLEGIPVGFSGPCIHPAIPSTASRLNVSCVRTGALVSAAKGGGIHGDHHGAEHRSRWQPEQNRGSWLNAMSQARRWLRLRVGTRSAAA